MSGFNFFAAPPEVIEPARENRVILLEEGETHSIICTAKGYPLPHVTWQETGRTDVPDLFNVSGAKTYNDLPSVSTTMTLENVVPELSANFTCKALNPDQTYTEVLMPSSVSVKVHVSGEDCAIGERFD